MSGPPGDDDEYCDSRTASVGQPRLRNGGVSNSHNKSDASGDRRERKRARLDDGTESSISRDAASKDTGGGGVGSTSSQESDSDNSADELQMEAAKAAMPQPPYKGSIPAVQWNRGSKSAIRTTLGKRGSASRASTPIQNQAGAAGEKGPSSSSLTSILDPGNHKPAAQGESQDTTNITTESDSIVRTEAQIPHTVVVSDGSESGEVTEGDDDIMLNLSGRDEGTAIRHDQMERMEVSEKVQLSSTHGKGDQVNSHQAKVNGSSESRRGEDDSITDIISSLSTGPAKDNAIRAQALKYREQPTVLANLSLADLEIQAKYIFNKLDTRDIDLSLPIKCISCRKEGHLAEVCPDKECKHCGAWERHESSSCPLWRRCQKCRERGHDKEHCSSRLIGTAAEVPCDRCGSNEHLENDCDMMWKSPWSHPIAGPITVSVSCINCKSRQHLIGDCSKLRHPLGSSSFSLKSYDPSMISEPNFSSGGSVRYGPRDGNNSGLRIRGRAEVRSPSPESDDMRSGPRHPIRRNAPRTHIRFAPNIGRDTGQNNRDDIYENQNYSHFQPHNDYRDRDQFIPNNTRQRSLSPDPRPVNRRGRGDRNGDSRRPPPREPSQTRGRGGQQHPPKPRGKFSMRGQSKRATGGRDAYRPLPGPAKKAWDKHRLG